MYCPIFFDVAFMWSLANGGGAVASLGGAAGGRSYPRGQFWCRAPFPTVRRMARLTEALGAVATAQRDRTGLP
jgi:hypothetical protein